MAGDVKSDKFREDKNFSPAARVHALKNGLTFDAKKYEFDDRFVPSDPVTANNAHTVQELMSLLESDKSVEIESKVMAVNLKKREAKFVRINGNEKFREAFKANKNRKFREMDDYFGTDTPMTSTVNSQDFTPLLGGPFYKQLYQYDYLRMHSACFYAWHHDPIAKATVEMIVDFVLGRGFKVEADNESALAYWEAFARVNNMPTLSRQYVTETCVYGESMTWKLPKGQTKITYQLSKGQQPPVGLIPRIRHIDPSCIWDIITYPEDITRVLAYVWMAPTQYQTYTAPGVPTTKFIFEHIPADQVMHHKINCASNEKRGRSDLFASMGYMKRLRDSVDYSIVAMQKAAAWSIDTTVEGSQADLDAYADSQKALGTIPAAGSEFIHTKAVERQYLSNGAISKGGASSAFDWCLSMIAAGNRIPVSYYGTHLSGGQTRASALVSTEPVAKFIESRQLMVEGWVKELFYWLTGEECEVIFPEIITQDSATKIRNIIVADTNQYFSKERCADMVAKELNVTEFNYEEEKAKIEKDIAQGVDFADPLTEPPAVGTKGQDVPRGTRGGGNGSWKTDSAGDGSSSAVTKTDRKDVAANG